MRTYGREPDFTLAGRILASHYERMDGKVVHVIDDFLIDSASRFHGKPSFIYLRDEQRRLIMNQLGIPKFLTGRSEQDNFCNFRNETPGAIPVTRKMVDETIGQKGGDQIA